MKVKNLIATLKGCDPEAEVYTEALDCSSSNVVGQYELEGEKPFVYIADSLEAVNEQYKNQMEYLKVTLNPNQGENDKKIVKSKTIYSPQNLIERLTGYYYCIGSDVVINEIQTILNKHGYSLRTFSIDEINTIVDEKVNVVLVDTSRYDSNEVWTKEFTWFEVPENFNDDIKHAKEQWYEFEDVPMNPETEEIEVEWNGFPAGTHREEIWHWFEETYNLSISALINNEL